MRHPRVIPSHYYRGAGVCPYRTTQTECCGVLPVDRSESCADHVGRPVRPCPECSTPTAYDDHLGRCSECAPSRLLVTAGWVA